MSNFLILFLEKNVSAEKGPSIFILFFCNFLIAGLIILSSSLNLFIVSPCGFKLNTANLGFFLDNLNKIYEFALHSEKFYF